MEEMLSNGEDIEGVRYLEPWRAPTQSMHRVPNCNQFIIMEWDWLACSTKVMEEIFHNHALCIPASTAPSSYPSRRLQ